MDKIDELSIPNENTRIIVISDIHGELNLFKQLLKKVEFSRTEDYLIINGDLCEKGSNSNGVVRYVMDLCANNPRVHVTEGNCDTLAEELLNENPQVISYLCKTRNSILNEWLEQIGYCIDEKSNIQQVKDVLLGHFSEEINWLIGLPTAIELDDYIFVHAGISDIENWKDTDRDTAVSVRSFLTRSHRANKYVIVGHYPVSNYTSDIPSNNPIIDLNKRIISIDGGNVLKDTGQLNAFIIHRIRTGDTFSHRYVDHFPECKVVKGFEADPKTVGSITYPDYGVIPVTKGDDFTLCQQAEKNQIVHVKNEYLRQTETGLFTVKTDVSCAQMSVSEGNIISVIDDMCTGYSLIKKDGLVGWVAKESLDLKVR